MAGYGGSPGQGNLITGFVSDPATDAGLAARAGLEWLSPAGDVVDLVQNSRDTVEGLRAGNWSQAGLGVGGMGLALAGTVLPGRPAQALDPLMSAARAIDPVPSGVPWRSVADAMHGLPEGRPAYIDPWVQMSEEMLARQAGRPRDLRKAYAMTRNSMQRSPLAATTLDAKSWPGYDGPVEGGKVGPEDALGHWFMTPTGQRYLDAADRGEVDTDAIADAADKLNSFGKRLDTIDTLTRAVTELPALMPEIQEAIRHGGTDELLDSITKTRGISNAKAGYMAAMLGRPDLPLFDARVSGIMTDDAKAAARAIYSQKPTSRAGIKELEALYREHGEDKPFYTHYKLWAGDEPFEHKGVTRAMRLAAIAPVGLAVGATALAGSDMLEDARGNDANIMASVTALMGSSAQVGNGPLGLSYLGLNDRAGPRA